MKETTKNQSINKAIIAGLPIIILVAFLAGYWMKGTPEEVVENHANHQHEKKQETIWTCSMHPQIRVQEPGLCPICAMDLIPAATGEDDTGPWELKLSDKAQKLASLEETVVEKRYVAHQIRVVGKVEPNEQLVGNITARFPGRIDRLFVDFSGTTVRKGDHLVSIYSPQLLTAQKELLEAVRSEQSGPDSLKKAAQARVRASREKLRLWNLTPSQIDDIIQRGKTTDHLTVFAPMKGIVLEKHRVEGDYVKEGTPIYTINDLSKVWVKMDIYESDLGWIRLGQKVEFKAEAYPGKRFEGKIVFIDPIVNPKTRTVRVRINVPNDDLSLKPDMFVRATIYAKLGQSGNLYVPDLIGKWMCPMHPEEVSVKPENCNFCGMPLEPTEELGFVNKEESYTDAPLVIPASAALLTGTRAVVYVAVPDKPGTYEGRQVELGPRAGEFYSVISGLEEGERVVSNGAFKIDSELQIQAKNSMMYAPGYERADEICLFETTESFRRKVSPLIEAYLDVSEALSADDLNEARKATMNMQASTKVKPESLEAKALFFWDKSIHQLQKPLSVIRATGDIDQARLQFERVSDLIFKLISTYQLKLSGDITRFHCPMAFDDRGAWWIQRGRDAHNPYFGSAMYTCFGTKEILSGNSSEGAGETAPKHRLPDRYNQAVSETLAQYFATQDALASDQAEEALLAFRKLAKGFAGLPKDNLTPDSKEAWNAWFALWVDAVQHAEHIQGLEKVRGQFDLISSALINLNETFNLQLGQPVFQFHCPMAFDDRGADWLQPKNDLLNPYFGASMLKCGSLKKEWPGESHDH